MYCFRIAKAGNGERFVTSTADTESRKALLKGIKKQVSGQFAIIAADGYAEMYYFGDEPENAEKYLSDAADNAEIEQYIGKSALVHLLGNSSEIAPEIETAFNESKSLDVSGFDVNTVLQAAMGFSKRDFAENRTQAASDEADETLKKLAMHSFRPFTERVREELSAMSLEALIKRFKEDMDAEQFSAVLESLKKLIGK